MPFFSTVPLVLVIGKVEARLGFGLATNEISVCLLHFSQPHSIRVTGNRYLTAAAYPFEIVFRNAIHEMMHPPFDWSDASLATTLRQFEHDAFVMNKVRHHNRSFGYNNLHAFLEEDCVQALEQLIEEKLQVAQDPRKRWRENDDGMHVFAVALYSLMRENEKPPDINFQDYLLSLIRSGKLAPGKVEALWSAFYTAK